MSLAQWRIDPSLLEFPGGARPFRGGNATVSKAFLTSRSAVVTTGVESKLAEDKRPLSDPIARHKGNDSVSHPDHKQNEGEDQNSRLEKGSNNHERGEGEKYSGVCQSKL